MYVYIYIYADEIVFWNIFTFRINRLNPLTVEKESMDA